LDNFELLRYIPVTIEPLGEHVFVAEASELNLSMTGRTPEDAVRLLKDAIARTYDGNRTRRNTLDADRRRQQRILETYIGKPKGVWHWA
jgi:predicted RNase H-like HicB family nuclease